MWPNSQETADLVTFTEEILNGKLQFLCSVRTCATCVANFLRFSWVIDLSTFAKLVFPRSNIQKQPFRGVLEKRCSENMLQIYRRAPMPKYDFNKVALQLYWNHKATLLKSHFDMDNHTSEHLSSRTPLNGCFWTLKLTLQDSVHLPMFVKVQIW